MIGNKRVLGIVPARGGSKGVPRKNVRLVGGKPLLAHTIEAAKRSCYIDEIVVSSDDAEILAVGAAWGAIPLQRPSHLALDETPGIDPVLHALEHRVGFHYVVLLQPTSPLRTGADIDGTIDHGLALGAPVCISICEAPVSPLRLFALEDGDRLRRLAETNAPNRRQDLPPAYVINGAVYFADATWLLRERRFISPETTGYLMPIERSLDIDTELDLEFADFIFKTFTQTSH